MKKSLLMHRLLLLLCLAALARPAAAQEDPSAWEFELRTTLWLAMEGNTRMRSMEQEAIGKGGTGHGTMFNYKDVAVDGVSFVPELELTVSTGLHQFRFGGFLSRIKERHFLPRDLEFDGDLWSQGDDTRIRFNARAFWLGYSYPILSGDLDIRLGLQGVYYFWSGLLQHMDNSQIQNGDHSSDESIEGFIFPAPTTHLRLKLDENLILHADAAVLYSITYRRDVAHTENSNGIGRLNVGLSWNTGSVHLDATLGYFMLDSVTFEHRDEADLLNYRRFGLQLGVVIDL